MPEKTEIDPNFTPGFDQIPLLLGGNPDLDGDHLRINPDLQKTEAPMEKDGISIPLNERAINLVEALDRLSASSRNVSLGYAISSKPNSERVRQGFKSEQDMFRASYLSAEKADKYNDQAKEFFVKALGLGALTEAGLEIHSGSDFSVEQQQKIEEDYQWKKFVETYAGSANAERRRKMIRMLRQQYRTVTKTPMPPRSLQVERARHRPAKKVA